MASRPETLVRRVDWFDSISQSNKTPLIIWISCGGLTILGLLFAFICICRRMRRRRKATKQKKDMEAGLKKILSFSEADGTMSSGSETMSTWRNIQSPDTQETGVERIYLANGEGRGTRELGDRPSVGPNDARSATQVPSRNIGIDSSYSHPGSLMPGRLISTSPLQVQQSQFIHSGSNPSVSRVHRADVQSSNSEDTSSFARVGVHNVRETTNHDRSQTISTLSYYSNDSYDPQTEHSPTPI